MALGAAVTDWQETSFANVFTGLTSCNPRLEFTFGSQPVRSLGTYTDSDGTSYSIHQTPIPSLGYVVGIKEGHAQSWRNFSGGSAVPLPANQANVSVAFRVKYVATGQRLARGSFVSQSVGEFNAGKEGLVGGGLVSFVYLNNTTFNVQTRGCSVSLGPQPVTLPQVVAQSLKAIGSESTVSKSFDVKLSCDPNVMVHAGMSDALNAGNRSDILSTRGEATGVGIRIYRESGGISTAVAYGPDVSGTGAYSHRWPVGSTGAGREFTLPFTARYVRTTQAIKPGTLSARAYITFSYQ
jgi:type 1 fimbria pilin